MTLWKWKAVDDQGNIHRGTREDTLAGSVVSHLRRQELYPVRIRRSLFTSLWTKFDSDRAKIYWARNARKIGTLLEAGIPLLTTLEIISEKETNPLRKERWLKVRQRVLAGNEFSASLEGFIPRPGFYVESMIRAGEKSGTLAECFQDVALQLEEEHFFEQKLKTALFYPALLLGVAVVVLYTLSIVILPMYETLFQGLEAELPLVTKALFKIGSNIPFLVLFLLGVGIFGRVLSGKEKPWVMPGTAQLRRYKALMQFCTLLGRLLNAGLPLLDSLAMLRQITKETEPVRLIAQLESAVKEGKRLSPVLAGHSFFPPEAAKMLGVAEESGKLCEMFLHLASVFRRELEDKLQQYTRFLEPVLVVGMAGLVGLVAIGVLLPLFDVSTHIR